MKMVSKRKIQIGTFVSFDEIVLQDHLNNIGCKTPYQKTAQTERICESNRECIPIARCPSIAKKHSEFLFLHSNGNKFSVEYQTLRRELQKSVCNRDKKGVCCTLEQDLPNYLPRLGNCGVPKRGLPKVSEKFLSTEHLHF